MPFSIAMQHAHACPTRPLFFLESTRERKRCRLRLALLAYLLTISVRVSAPIFLPSSYVPPPPFLLAKQERKY